MKISTGHFHLLSNTSETRSRSSYDIIIKGVSHDRLPCKYSRGASRKMDENTQEEVE